MSYSKGLYYGVGISILLLSASLNSNTCYALSDQSTSMPTNVKNLEEAQSVMASWKDEQAKTTVLLDHYKNVIVSYEKQRVSLGKLKTKLSSMGTLPLEAQETILKMHEDFLDLKTEGKSTEERLKATLDNLDTKLHEVDETLQSYQAKTKDVEGKLDLLNKKIEKGQTVIDRMKNFQERMRRFEPVDKTSTETGTKTEQSKGKVSELIKRFEK